MSSSIPACFMTCAVPCSWIASSRVAFQICSIALRSLLNRLDYNAVVMDHKAVVEGNSMVIIQAFI